MLQGSNLFCELLYWRKNDFHNEKNYLKIKSLLRMGISHSAVCSPLLPRDRIGCTTEEATYQLSLQVAIGRSPQTNLQTNGRSGGGELCSLEGMSRGHNQTNGQDARIYNTYVLLQISFIVWWFMGLTDINTPGWFHGFRENAEISFSYYNSTFFMKDRKQKNILLQYIV